MKVALVGPELEENLGLRYLDASLCEAGHRPRIFDFHHGAQIPVLVEQIAAFNPGAVGLSMVFTGRAREYVDLAEALRAGGFEGWIVAGGHFASFNAEALLAQFPALNFVIHGEGEAALNDLLANLGDPAAVAGLTYRAEDGTVAATGPRPNPDDLDALPRPTRPERLHDYMGLPIANILSGRGCHGGCYYCSIAAWARQNGGRRFRQRRVAEVAREMAALYHERGVRIFNFHDDNFFLKGRWRNLERFRALKSALDNAGVGRIALQVKARPDSVDEETMALLQELGLFRVFLGVESNAAAGLKTLGRGIRREENHRALRLLLDLGLHVTFNLLMFDPECTPADLRDNVAFMRQYARVPQNFGRAEVYAGTPLERGLREQGRLRGDLFGFGYDIANPRAQLVFDLYRRLFLARNFQADGLSLQAMSLDFHLHLLRHFYPRRANGRLERAVKSLIAEINGNSADLLAAACDFAEPADLDDAETTERLAAQLVCARDEFDAAAKPEARRLLGEMRALGRDNGKSRKAWLPRAAAAAAALTLGAVGCKPSSPAPDGDGLTPTKPPKPTPERPGVRELSQDDKGRVGMLISTSYQDGLNAIGADYDLLTKTMRLRLNLDAKGRVASFDIRLPAGVKQQAECEKRLGDLIKTWRFPQISGEGGAWFNVKFEQRQDWHIFEMMMAPMEPKVPGKAAQE